MAPTYTSQFVATRYPSQSNIHRNSICYDLPCSWGWAPYALLEGTAEDNEVRDPLAVSPPECDSLCDCQFSDSPGQERKVRWAGRPVEDFACGCDGYHRGACVDNPAGSSHGHGQRFQGTAKMRSLWQREMRLRTISKQTLC